MKEILFNSDMSKITGIYHTLKYTNCETCFIFWGESSRICEYYKS